MLGPAPAKFVLPGDERDAPQMPFAGLEAETAALSALAGGYPVRLEDTAQKREAYARWLEALLDARAYLKSEGETERVLTVLAKLYRQGHNMDVEGAGSLAVESVDFCLAKYPRSRNCHFAAAYLFLVVSPEPQYLTKAENSLKILQNSYMPKAREDVEDALVYLYAYQRKNAAALKQIDRYLAIFPKAAKRETFLRLKAALKEKRQDIYPGSDFPGPSGVWR